MSDHYTEETKGASDGRIGADRMALGLGIIPDANRGDLDEVARLTTLLESTERQLQDVDEELAWEGTGKGRLETIREMKAAWAWIVQSPKP
jgi:hypothetical protein